MAEIELKLRTKDLRFEHNVARISVDNVDIPCTGISIMFSASGMEYLQFTVPMNFINIVYLEEQPEEKDI